MFILSSISSGLELWSVSHSSIYKNSELKVFKNIKVFGEISSNWPNDLSGTNYKQDYWILLIIIVSNSILQ